MDAVTAVSTVSWHLMTNVVVLIQGKRKQLIRSNKVGWVFLHCGDSDEILGSVPVCPSVCLSHTQATHTGWRWGGYGWRCKVRGPEGRKSIQVLWESQGFTTEWRGKAWEGLGIETWRLRWIFMGHPWLCEGKGKCKAGIKDWAGVSVQGLWMSRSGCGRHQEPVL